MPTNPIRHLGINLPEPQGAPSLASMEASTAPLADPDPQSPVVKSQVGNEASRARLIRADAPKTSAVRQRLLPALRPQFRDGEQKQTGREALRRPDIRRDSVPGPQLSRIWRRPQQGAERSADGG